MTSISRIVGILAALGAIAGGHAHAAPATAPAETKQPSVQDRDIAAQLDQTLPAIKFDSVGLSDAIDFCRDVSGGNIFVNFKALEAAGIDKQAPVTLKLSNVTLGKCLRLLLDCVGGTQGKLAMEVDRGVITISTGSDLGQDAVAFVRGNPQRRPFPAREPETPIPDAIKKLKGKTVLILYDIGASVDESGASHYDERFLAELLEKAGAKVRWQQGSNPQPGEVIVFGKYPRPGLSQTPSKSEREAFERGKKREEAYLVRKKQLTTDVIAAGGQTVEDDQVRLFFGLDSKTDAAWARYPEVVAWKPDQAQLDFIIPTAKFDAVGLGDVIDYLRDSTGANIFVNWKALKTAGIDQHTPVTLNLKNAPFSKVLEAMLDSLGGKAKLDYEIESHVFTISTARDLSGETAGVTIAGKYDIRFMVRGVDAVERDKRIAGLKRMVTETVDPSSWGLHDGTLCTLMELNGELIVVQTEENQKLVEKLIRQLKESAKAATP
jgi:hypothetical protein